MREADRVDTISRGEMVEAEQNAYIARADKRRRESEGERDREAIYMESVRRHHAWCQQSFAWEWLRWHQRMLNNHTRTAALITAHHRSEIQKYEQLLNIDYQGGDAA